MSNWLCREKRMAVVDALMRGDSVRTVARNVGVSKVTVGQYRKLISAAELCGLDDARLPMCECGKNAGHKEWCETRIGKSEARQNFLNKWR